MHKFKIAKNYLLGQFLIFALFLVYFIWIFNNEKNFLYKDHDQIDKFNYNIELLSPILEKSDKAAKEGLQYALKSKDSMSILFKIYYFNKSIEWLSEAILLDNKNIIARIYRLKIYESVPEFLKDGNLLNNDIDFIEKNLFFLLKNEFDQINACKLVSKYKKIKSLCEIVLER